MITVNLKDLYPWITEDEYIEITEEMYEAMKSADRQENNYARRTRYHKAFYSLNYADWMENYTAEKVSSPEELYEQKFIDQTLYAAIRKLTEKQRQRLCDFYFEGMSKAGIARRDGVSSGCVCQSIYDALAKLEKEISEKILPKG